MNFSVSDWLSFNTGLDKLDWMSEINDRTWIVCIHLSVLSQNGNVVELLSNCAINIQF